MKGKTTNFDVTLEIWQDALLPFQFHMESNSIEADDKQKSIKLKKNMENNSPNHSSVFFQFIIKLIIFAITLCSSPKKSKKL